MESSAELEYTFYQQLMRKFEVQYIAYSIFMVSRFKDTGFYALLPYRYLIDTQDSTGALITFHT